MSLSLYVDAARWRKHIDQVRDGYPGIVPVMKGNGYGFDNVRLAEEASRMGVDIVAVGTTYEAARLKDHFDGRVMVLTPYLRGEDAVPLPDRAIRTVSSVQSARDLVGSRVVISCMTSMKRDGVTPEDLVTLRGSLEGVRLEGFSVHLPLDHPDGQDPVAEVAQWVERLKAARLPVHTMFVSHVPAAGLAALQQQHPDTRFRPRIGTDLWLGDHDSLVAKGTVLDVVPVARGERFGYRQRKAPADGHLLVVSGGTAHGVGLEAPKTVRGVMPRAKGVARAGLATVNRTLSPFSWAGKQRWFAEPPHMQVSLLFLPGEVEPPKPGTELEAELRHTTTHFDRVVLR
ncbi:alanine racemase [Yinghuangia seranimata]|uniref:alanine racemase n=1 Tax=Yinghuangia seranimata TaxID=408067 RepID=UPI00248BCAEB|nr:alanine racemase [Yinghuangia seranimata]MDI2130460.1 alanine racemase [Yinghuangia seranimata]